MDGEFHCQCALDDRRQLCFWEQATFLNPAAIDISCTQRHQYKDAGHRFITRFVCRFTFAITVTCKFPGHPFARYCVENLRLP
mgnify:CR=1 FL=1